MKPEFKILCNLRIRLNSFLNGKSRPETTKELLGCDFRVLKKHLCEKFEKRMTWKNYGSYWVVDHIKPCALFDLTKHEERKKCFHYTNLQPLTAAKNASKGAKYNG